MDSNSQVEWPAQCTDCGDQFGGVSSSGVVTKDVEVQKQLYRLCYCRSCFEDRGLGERVKEHFMGDVEKYRGFLGAFAP